MAPATDAPEVLEQKSTDPFDEIDFDTYFDEYLDPGYKSPASENIEKPSFETFLSSPVTLSDHLHSQLAWSRYRGSSRRGGDDHRQFERERLLDAGPGELATSGNHQRPM